MTVFFPHFFPRLGVVRFQPRRVFIDQLIQGEQRPRLVELGTVNVENIGVFAPRCTQARPECSAGLPPLRAENGRELRCV